MDNDNKRREVPVDNENGPRKKRNRAVLSCIPCKRRKVRCDRNIPCGTCVRRHEEHLCVMVQPDASSDHVHHSREVIVDPEASRHASPLIRFMKEHHPYSVLRNASRLVESVAGKDVMCSPDKMPAPMHPEFLKSGSTKFNNKFHRSASQSDNAFDEDDGSAGPHVSSHSAPSTVKLSFPPDEWSHKSSIYVGENEDEDSAALMREACKHLPSLEFLQATVDYYFEHIYWFIAVIPPSLFRSYFAAFRELLTVDKVPAEHIDPAFISILVSMSAMVVYSLRLPASFGGRIYTPGSWDKLGILYFSSAQKALAASHWLEFPSIRTIHAALFIVAIATNYIERNAGLAQSNIILCYHHCLKLNFHVRDFQLGITVPFDPCLPPNNVILNREIRRRTLAAVALYYVFTVSTCGVSGDITNFSNYPFPKNCDLEELLNPVFFNPPSSDIHTVSENQDALIDHPSTEIRDSWITLALLSPLSFTRNSIVSVHSTVKDLRISREVENVIARSSAALAGFHLVVSDDESQETVLRDNRTLIVPVDGFDSESNIDILDAIPISPPNLNQSQLWRHRFALTRSYRMLFQLHSYFTELFFVNGNYPLAAIKLIRISRSLLRTERMNPTSFIEDTTIFISFLQRPILSLLITAYLRDQITRFSDDVLKPATRARLNELLDLDLLKDDVRVCRARLHELKTVAADTTEPFANRASYARSCIQVVEPLLFAVETKLGITQPDIAAPAHPPPPPPEDSLLSSTVNHIVSSQDPGLLDLNQIFALSDDLGLFDHMLSLSPSDPFNSNLFHTYGL